MRTLHLTNGRAVVDEEDYEPLAAHTWTDIGSDIKNERGESLARLVYGQRARIGYRNGDRFDCRARNLFRVRSKPKPKKDQGEDLPEWYDVMLAYNPRTPSPNAGELRYRMWVSGSRDVSSFVPEGWRVYLDDDRRVCFRPNSEGVWWPYSGMQ